MDNEQREPPNQWWGGWDLGGEFVLVGVIFHLLANKCTLKSLDQCFYVHTVDAGVSPLVIHDRP